MNALRHPDSAVIDALGGTNKVAELCRVKPPSVSDWRKTGIPDARRMFLEVVRPDVDWACLTDTPKQPEMPASTAHGATQTAAEQGV